MKSTWRPFAVNKNTWLLSLCSLYRWASANGYTGTAQSAWTLIQKEKIG